jgi:hypothetical protein
MIIFKSLPRSCKQVKKTARDKNNAEVKWPVGRLIHD